MSNQSHPNQGGQHLSGQKPGQQGSGAKPVSSSKIRTGNAIKARAAASKST